MTDIVDVEEPVTKRRRRVCRFIRVRACPDGPAPFAAAPLPRPSLPPALRAATLHRQSAPVLQVDDVVDLEPMATDVVDPEPIDLTSSAHPPRPSARNHELEQICTIIHLTQSDDTIDLTGIPLPDDIDGGGVVVDLDGGSGEGGRDSDPPDDPDWMWHVFERRGVL